MAHLFTSLFTSIPKTNGLSVVACYKSKDMNLIITSFWHIQCTGLAWALGTVLMLRPTFMSNISRDLSDPAHKTTSVNVATKEMAYHIQKLGISHKQLTLHPKKLDISLCGGIQISCFCLIMIGLEGPIQYVPKKSVTLTISENIPKPVLCKFSHASLHNIQNVFRGFGIFSEIVRVTHFSGHTTLLKKIKGTWSAPSLVCGHSQVQLLEDMHNCTSLKSWMFKKTIDFTCNEFDTTLAPL